MRPHSLLYSIAIAPFIVAPSLAQAGTCGPCPHPGFCPPTPVDGHFGFENHSCEDLKSSISPLFTAFNDSDFSCSDLSGTFIGSSNLERSTFRGALLVGTALGGAFLCDADFSGADLTNANLSNTSPEVVCDNPFFTLPPPRYDCDTIWTGTYFDTLGIDPQDDGWLLVNPPCANVSAFGAMAPPTSIMVVSDRPKLGGVFTVAIDDPVGATSPGSFAALLVSAQPDPNFIDGLPPFGTLIPGLNMNGGPGELLVSLVPPDFLASISGNSVWQPGSPVTVDVFIPANPALLGAVVYSQGVLAAPGNVKATDGLILMLGN